MPAFNCSKKEKTMLSTALWTNESRSSQSSSSGSNHNNNGSELDTDDPSRSLSSTEGDESSASMENSN